MKVVKMAMNDDFIEDILDEITQEKVEEEKKLLEETKRLEKEKLESLTYKPLKKKNGGNNLRDVLDNSIQRNINSRKSKDMIDGLTQAQLLSIEMICKGMMPSQIAKELGVTRQSVNNWKRNSQYMSVLEKTKKDYISSFQQHIMSKIPSAVKTIVDIMEDESASNKDRISASRTILEFSEIKKGGLQEANNNDNGSNTPTVIMINATPPTMNKENKAKVVKNENEDEFVDINVDEVIDVDID